MIRVHYDPSRLHLLVRGHGGWGPQGEDLICAGVTTLLLTLRESCGGGLLTRGYGELQGTEKDREAFTVICRGLKYLGQTYPRHLFYHETGDGEGKKSLINSGQNQGKEG